MSSILDALKKLEEERAQAKRPGHDDPSEDVAERELLGRSVLRERLTIRLTPLTLVFGGLGLTTVFVVISVVITMTLIQRQVSNGSTMAVPSVVTAPPGAGPSLETLEVARANPLASAPGPGPDPGSVVSAQAPSPKDELESAQTGLTPEPEPEPVDDAPEGQPDAPVESADALEPPQEEVSVDARADQPDATETPPPASVETARAERVAETPPRQASAPPLPVPPPAAPDTKPPAPAATYPPPDLDMAALALRPLRESDRLRLGLTGLQINMLQPANRNRPYDSAIINLNRVDLGEIIPRTHARLVALDGLEGIVIEIEGTHERFYVRF